MQDLWRTYFLSMPEYCSQLWSPYTVRLIAQTVAVLRHYTTHRTTLWSKSGRDMQRYMYSKYWMEWHHILESKGIPDIEMDVTILFQKSRTES